MAITSKITITGLKRAKLALNKHPRIASVHLANAINASIVKIEQKTFPLTPKKTGKLRAQYPHDRILAFPNKALLLGAVRNTTPYALKVHNLHPIGNDYANPTTAGSRPHFLTLGAKKAEPQVNKEFDDALDNIIKDLVK